MTIITRLSRGTRLQTYQFKPTWNTPRELYLVLDKEFHFDHDPCPANPSLNGIFSQWGHSNYVNPPYGAPIGSWLQKAIQELRNGNSSVFLLPTYTDVAWFHDYVLKYASEIRFIRGRLKFVDEKGKRGSSPFGSMICVFKPTVIPHEPEAKT